MNRNIVKFGITVECIHSISDRRVLNCQSTLILGLLYKDLCKKWFLFSQEQLTYQAQQFYQLVTMPGNRACQNYAPGTVTYGGVSANSNI